jgi:5-methylcytosine-specific restriction endonuclease McrA
MSQLRQKMPRMKLSSAEYQELRVQVLKRDGWCCQICGKLKDLHVYHLKSRSDLGGDTTRNPITLYSGSCHRRSHSVGED